MLIRQSSHTLKFANKGKVDLYWRIVRDYNELLQMYIDMIHSGQLPLKMHLSSKKLPVLNDIVHSHWRVRCYDEASQIYRGCLAKKKKKFKKPVVKRHSVNITDGTWDIKLDASKEFDCFVRIYSPYMKSAHRSVKFNIPIKFHKASNKLRDDGWELDTSSMMLRDNFSLCLFWRKEEPEKKSTDMSIGVDCGYKKLLACSDGKVYGRELEPIYEKIARKKQGSKAFKRALKERDYAINKTVKKFYADHKDCGVVACENLKNIKRGKKFSKKFTNKLQRWSYTKTLDKLESLSETEGFRLVKVPPAYTSQRCHRCKCVIKSNRSGERYHCSVCGEEIDADINAAINILQLGAYGLQHHET